MAASVWSTKTYAIASLHLDGRNPRLGPGAESWPPREIIQYFFENDDAIEVAESIAFAGYFANEPLLGVREGGKVIVVEGNRRLSALKALREPALVTGAFGRRVEKLARRIADPSSIASVPVTIAPSRRATDRQLVARHVRTPVRAWLPENRALFILEKLDEGYSTEELRDSLGFGPADVQQARQTRAIAGMARSLTLPPDVTAKLDGPRSKVLTTLERVFDSTVGREYLKIATDPDHGVRIKSKKDDFVRAFTRLVSDVALGKQSSRTLNSNENIRQYFESWPADERPRQSKEASTPSDFITEKPARRDSTPAPEGSKSKGAKKIATTVLPKNFQVKYGSARLVDLRDELTKIDRTKNPNSGAVLLRVFLEIAIVDYLTRSGRLASLIAELEKKQGRKLPFSVPQMKELLVEMTRIAKERLQPDEVRTVEKALKYDSSAPFTISDLHGFVHSSDLPSDRDILVFWTRTEPLFRMMLEQPVPEEPT